LLLAWIIGLWGLAVTAAEAKTIQIVLSNLTYVPAETTASVGDIIEWVNNDILAHTATATNGDWNVVIAAKKTERLVLKKSGQVDYFCTYHPNMKGRLTIAP
jgi:plastocyanin